MKSVYPSGGASLTGSAPTLPPPPGRLSSSTGCFTLSDSFCPTRRISTSALPPGVNGITMVGASASFTQYLEKEDATWLPVYPRSQYQGPVALLMETIQGTRIEP